MQETGPGFPRNLDNCLRMRYTIVDNSKGCCFTAEMSERLNPQT